MKRAKELSDQLATTTDTDKAEALEWQINTLLQNARDASKVLGVEAGRAVAAQRFPTGRVVVMREGSGVPDILVVMPDGTVIPIECKGGKSPLGGRTTVDGLHYARQAIGIT